uniref:Uncharacterized protein n=1 Tax=Panagrolaimus sp. PS1159 TaxID=55785 RepID=A0AC35FMH6_9BILA
MVYVITLDLEPFVSTPQKVEPKKYRYKDRFKGTKKDDLMIKDLILHVKSIDLEIQQLALSKLSKILHRPKCLIENLVENGILPILVEFLQSET